VVEVVLEVEVVEVVEVENVAAFKVAMSQLRTVMELKCRHVASVDSIYKLELTVLWSQSSRQALIGMLHFTLRLPPSA